MAAADSLLSILSYWTREYYDEQSINNILTICIEHVSIYFNGDINDKMNELFVKIGVIGDDVADKIGLIYNYVYDNNCQHLLQNGQMIKLKRENESNILKMEKCVQLSSRNRVNISIFCLSEIGRSKLSQLCHPSIKSLIFTFNLCQQCSLQSIRKYFKECRKSNDKFIPILVGTHYEEFKDKAANYRVSLIEQSRKYARKMRAILIFVSTLNGNQINIKEVFLLILSKLYHFDSQIMPISNGKLPIIEFYDKATSNHKSKKHQRHKTTNVSKRSSLIRSKTPGSNHNRTKTSISAIQNRLSVIRSNLEAAKHRSSHSPSKTPRLHTNNRQSKVDQLYNKFEAQYQSFMSKQFGSKSSNNISVPSNSTAMYPLFLQSQSVPFSNEKSESNEEHIENNTLSDLLKNDALGLETLQKTKSEPSDVQFDEQIKRKKHQRALSMMPSLERAKTANNILVNKNNKNKSSQHRKAMPSMPHFLNRVRTDSQLKTIITNVFTETNKHNRTVTTMKHSVPIPKFSSNQSKEDSVHGLHQKIEQLETALNEYQKIIKENRETTNILKETIAKVQSQRDAATKKINSMQNEKSDEGELLKLKAKNSELEELSTALAQNLARKQKSLEDALNAIHSLHEKKQKMETSEEAQHEQKDSKSLTDTDILSLTHANVVEPDDENENEENIILFRPQSSDSSVGSNEDDINQIHPSLFSSKGMAQRIKSMSKSWGKSSK